MANVQAVSAMEIGPPGAQGPIAPPTTTREHPRLALNRCMGSTATFEIVSEEGTPHEKSFTVKTVVQGKEFTGKGRSKKLAYQDASEQALLGVYNMKYVPNVDDGHQSESAPTKRKSGANNGQSAGTPQVKTALMRLNELHKGLSWECTEKGDQRLKQYVMTVVINGQTFTGEGSSKQVAKQNCATSAMQVIDPNFIEGLVANKKLVQQAGGVTMTGDHPRMVLNQKTGKSIESVLMDSNGQSIDSKYTVKIVVEEQDFYGSGSNKKSATQQACENALWSVYGIQYNPAIGPTPGKKAKKGGGQWQGQPMMA